MKSARPLGRIPEKRWQHGLSTL